MKIHITIKDENGQTYEGNADLVKVKSPKGKTIIAPIKKKPTPTDTIHKLYIENFFKTEKKLGDVTKKLETQGYNFNADSVYRALERAPFLQKRGSKGKYKFIQKFPPT